MTVPVNVECDYFSDCHNPAVYEGHTPDEPGARPLCVEHGATVRGLLEKHRADGGPLRRWAIRSLTEASTNG